MTVAGNHIGRLRRLEAAIAPSGRWFVVCDDGGDVEAVARRLRDEEGMTDRDILVIVRHLSEAEENAPQEDRTLAIATGVPRAKGFGK
jgi:hypothetical protein